METGAGGHLRPPGLVLTHTYDDDHLPESKEAANRYFARFIRRFRAARKKRGAELQYIYVTEGYHEKRANDWLVEDGTLEDRRLHHHVVINATDVDDLEEIRSLWQGGGYIRRSRWTSTIIGNWPSI